MKRHPNFDRIAALQAEIRRLSDEVAIPLLDEFFSNDDNQNCSKFARDHGVKQSWLAKRLNADPRYTEMKTRQRMWAEMDAGKFSLSDLS